MVKVGIIYFTGNGHTALLAEAVALGVVAAEDTQVEVSRIEGSQIGEGRWSSPEILDRLTQCDVLVFGAPTYMGGPAAQFKAFADGTAFVWRNRTWKGKLAAGFTTSGNPSGDKLNTLSYFHSLAAQHGMIWLNWDEMPRQPDGTNHLGSYTGLMALNAQPPGSAPVLTEMDRISAERFGRYVGTTAKRLGK